MLAWKAHPVTHVQTTTTSAALILVKMVEGVLTALIRSLASVVNILQELSVKVMLMNVWSGQIFVITESAATRLEYTTAHATLASQGHTVVKISTNAPLTRVKTMQHVTTLKIGTDVGVPRT